LANSIDAFTVHQVRSLVHLKLVTKLVDAARRVAPHEGLALIERFILPALEMWTAWLDEGRLQVQPVQATA
jgi:hypothetical protein